MESSALAAKVRIGGGPETIRQYLRAGLIDELHIAISPLILGAGEPRIGAHGTPILFLHPRDMGGVLIELMETPKGGH